MIRLKTRVGMEEFPQLETHTTIYYFDYFYPFIIIIIIYPRRVMTCNYFNSEHSPFLVFFFASKRTCTKL